MSEPTDHTLALLPRMDAKLDRFQADVNDLRGRLQRVEGRLTSLDARLGVLETFEGGLMRGRRSISGGRKPVRAVLYMAALVATRRNPTIDRLDERLHANGKAKKLAVTACMRKLLVILNAVLASGILWRPAQPA